jgi:hypothetical protein
MHYLYPFAKKTILAPYFGVLIPGNALAQVQRVNKPIDFWTSPFAPADFEALSTIGTRGF